MMNAGAAKLKTFRGKRSLEAVSGKIGATRMAWHGWENGNRIPSREYMPKLVGLVPELDAHLEDYVTQKTLDGLYLMIAEEEKAIRHDPAGAAGNLAKKVFGALK